MAATRRLIKRGPSSRYQRRLRQALVKPSSLDAVKFNA